MRILGIDPGLATLGYGIIDDKGKKNNSSFTCVSYGIISTLKNTSIGKRLHLIEKELNFFIKQHKPDAASVETLFFFKNQKTIIQIGQVHGVLALTLHKRKIPIYHYAPLHVKNVLTGNGRAKKEEVERKVRKLLGFRKKITPDDTADALAVALCYFFAKKKTENWKIGI